MKTFPTTSALPLSGIRVLSLGGIGPVPFAGMVLADMGATVTRVERPDARTGDGTVAHGVLFRDQGVFLANLKESEDRGRLLDEIGTTHIVLEGFRPGVAERLGLGPEDLQAINPRLVYGRMTGWGRDGPLAQRAGHDINYVALSGALAPIVSSDKTPVPPLNLLGDFGGGAMYLVAGVLSGLIKAMTTGTGCTVDAAIVDGCASMTAMLHSMRAAGQWDGGVGGNLLDGGAPFYRCYRTRDDRFMAVGAIEPEFFQQLLIRLELDDFEPREQYNPSQWPRLEQRLTDVFATRTQAQWVTVFDGSDACVSEVVSPDEVLDQPHLATRGTYELRDGDIHPRPAPRFY